MMRRATCRMGSSWANAYARMRSRAERTSTPAWEATIDDVLAEATLDRPTRAALPGTGRAGRHTEHLGYLLAEMQYLHRLHPGATW